MRAAGEIIGGRYRLDAPIGSGGMGVVHAATDLATGRPVAVKLVRPDADGASTARLLREGRIVSSLTTEHVAHVLDAGVLDDGSPYVAMERLVGATLRARVEEGGPLPIARAADYVIQACDALAEAHARGVVHRDIKPSNLFLARDARGETVKVLDFGISRAPLLRATSDATSRETMTGALLGSPPFMSPEQVRAAKDVDARTDLWSLGVVLYWSVSGKMPFAADSLLDLMTLIAYDAPAPLDVPGGAVPAGFADVVLRCLAKRREDRYASAAELASALAPFATDLGRRVVGVVLTRGPVAWAAPSFRDDARPRPASAALDETVSLDRGRERRRRQGFFQSRVAMAIGGALVVIVVSGAAAFASRSTRARAAAPTSTAASTAVASSIAPSASTPSSIAPSASTPTASATAAPPATKPADPAPAARGARGTTAPRTLHARPRPSVAKPAPTLPSTPD